MKTTTQTLIALLVLFLISSCAQERLYPNYHIEKKEGFSFRRFNHKSHADNNYVIKKKAALASEIAKNVVESQTEKINESQTPPQAVSVSSSEKSELKKNQAVTNKKVRFSPVKKVLKESDNIRETVKLIVKNPQTIASRFSKKENIAAYHQPNSSLLWTIIGVLLLIYLLGLLFGNVGGLVHLLLLVILILIIINLLHLN